MPKRETMSMDESGRVSVPDHVWKQLLKQVGSKAKSMSGQRKAVKKELQRLLLGYIRSGGKQ